MKKNLFIIFSLMSFYIIYPALESEIIRDTANNSITILYKDGTSNTIKYDDNGKVVYTFKYDGLNKYTKRGPNGELIAISIKYPNGSMDTANYDTNGHKFCTVYTYPDGSVTVSTLDTKGNVTSVFENKNGLRKYTEYDASGKIISIEKDNSDGSAESRNINANGEVISTIRTITEMDNILDTLLQKVLIKIPKN